MFWRRAHSSLGKDFSVRLVSSGPSQTPTEIAVSGRGPLSWFKVSPCYRMPVTPLWEPLWARGRHRGGGARVRNPGQYFPVTHHQFMRRDVAGLPPSPRLNR